MADLGEITVQSAVADRKDFCKLAHARFRVQIIKKRIRFLVFL